MNCTRFYLSLILNIWILIKLYFVSKGCTMPVWGSTSHFIQDDETQPRHKNGKKKFSYSWDNNVVITLNWIELDWIQSNQIELRWFRNESKPVSKDQRFQDEGYGLGQEHLSICRWIKGLKTQNLDGSQPRLIRVYIGGFPLNENGELWEWFWGEEIQIWWCILTFLTVLHEARMLI